MSDIVKIFYFPKAYPTGAPLSNKYRKKNKKRRTECSPLGVLSQLSFFNAVVEVRNQRVHIDAVSAGAFADRFEVGCHAAYAAQTVVLEDFDNLRVFLYRLNNVCVSGNGHTNASLLFYTK